MSIGENGNASHGFNWSMDPKRLNVAITRAKLKCYVLATPEFVKLAQSEENPYDESRNAWKMMNETAIIINNN